MRKCRILGNFSELISQDPNHRIRLTCRTVDLEPCGPLGRDSPVWKDYLIGKGVIGKKI